MKNKIFKFDKNDISFDENNKIHLNCSKELIKDINDSCGIDILNSQHILRHIYFDTVDGQVSFTVPNKILHSNYSRPHRSTRKYIKRK